eukprot:6579698-Ditylum_brightwellii.AAC.1
MTNVLVLWSQPWAYAYHTTCINLAMYRLITPSTPGCHPGLRAAARLVSRKWKLVLRRVQSERRRVLGL